MQAVLERTQTHTTEHANSVETEYQHAVKENDKIRRRLIACAEGLVQAWRARSERAAGSAPQVDPATLMELDTLLDRPVYLHVPFSEELITADEFLSHLIYHALQGYTHPMSVSYRRCEPILSDVTWEDAMALVEDTRERLLRETPINDRRILMFTGQA